MRAAWLSESAFLILCVARLVAMPTTDSGQVGSQAWMMAEIDALIRTFRCQHWYIDIGTNRGVQIRKLFEPARYPNATVLPLYHKLFGPRPECARVCVLGFEPNPHHHNSLFRLQNRLRSLGAGVLVVPAAAGDAEGVLTFAVNKPNRTDENSDWSASAFPAWRGTAQWDRIMPKGGFGLHAGMQVPMVDVAPAIKAVSASLDAITGHVLMKMDCEGGEYKLLPHLAFSQALCLADYIYIEWHEQIFSRAVAKTNAVMQHLRGGHQGSDAMVVMMRAIHDTAQAITTRAGCPTVLKTLADEDSYLEKRPLPLGPLCDASAQVVE